MTAEKLSDHADKPDDPADACRAITRTLLPLTDFGRQELVGQFCRLVEVLASVEENEAEAWERSRYAIALFACRAKDEAEAHIDAIDHALSLARHGTPEGREQDRRIREGVPLVDPGPTVAEVKAAQRVLAAYGDDASEEAALKVLASMEGESVGEAS